LTSARNNGLPNQSYAGGGNILPPKARPLGLSLENMAKALAYFYTSNNDPKYLQPPYFYPPPAFRFSTLIAPIPLV
jgi:hypothetical protein